MKVLNLYAGIGGNRKLWENVEVTAIENEPKIAKIYQRFFPNDKLIVSDAHQFLLEHFREFDFIWSSPPCQTHSKLNKATRHNTIRYADMSLYQEIILLQNFFKGKWVVENVDPYYEPLIKPQTCGRHNIWANFRITDIRIGTPRDFLHARKKQMMDWLGIHFDENIYLDGNHCEVQILRNAVHPKIGLHLLNQAFRDKQKTLGDKNGRT